MPLHFQNGKAVEKLVPASTKTVKVMGPLAVPEAVLHDMLAHLAALGVFARFAPPAGAPMPAEVWQALAQLGDAEWLAGLDGYDKDTHANAQRFIERYCRGLAVPAPGDPRP
jgi:hypothetical protein